MAQVVINEFVPNFSTEWVEFYNSSSSAEYLKSYYIDDDTDFNSDTGSSAKKQLTGLITASATFPYFELSSVFNNSGDYVVLFDEGGNLVDKYQYTSDPGNGVSIGRYPDGSGSFYILTSATKGLTNSSPTPTSTPTPTPTPSPANTSEGSIRTPSEESATPTPASTSVESKPTSKQSATRTPFGEPVIGMDESRGEANVLGIRQKMGSSSESGEVKVAGEEVKKFPFLAVGFILLGVSLISASVVKYTNEKKDNLSS